MKRSVIEDVGFIYRFWFLIFDGLEKLLPFSILGKFIFKNTKAFSDKWVLANTCMSIAFAVALHRSLLGSYRCIIIMYACIRILEIVVYQINVLLFHPYKRIVKGKMSSYKIKSPYRSVVLLGHNFVEVVFWFTCATTYFMGNELSFTQSVMENTIRIFTFDYQIGERYPVSIQTLLFFEVVCGIILTVVSLAKFIGELPHVDVRIEPEKSRKNTGR